MSHRGHREHRVGEVEAKVWRAGGNRSPALLKIVWVAGRGIMSKDAHATSKNRQENVVQGGVDYRRGHLFLWAMCVPNGSCFRVRPDGKI